jgi:hypothetical protein
MGKQIITVVDAPEVSLSENETPVDALLKFYRALGWNGDDFLDPCKVRTTKAVFNYLYKVMDDKCPNSGGVAMAIINIGPGVDDYIPSGQVYLLEGWTRPAKPAEEA